MFINYKKNPKRIKEHATRARNIFSGCNFQKQMNKILPLFGHQAPISSWYSSTSHNHLQSIPPSLNLSIVSRTFLPWINAAIHFDVDRIQDDWNFVGIRDPIILYCHFWRVILQKTVHFQECIALFFNKMSLSVAFL